MKKVSIIMAFFLLIAVLAVGTHAANPKIVDNADLLTSFEESYLENMATDIVNTYGIDVVILTVPSTNGKDVTAYADDYFDYNGYGIGSEHSGVLFMLSMADRDWVISTCGEGMDALTKYGHDQLMELVLPYLKNNNYYQGFQIFLSELEVYLEAYSNGEPIEEPENVFANVLICLIVGALAGLITILVMRSGMKTAVFQHGARDYMIPDSYQLRQQRDIFLYSHVTKVRRSSDSSSGSHRGSSGRSHGGSSGKF